ncbi:MAG: hydrolase [Bacteroidetes bacterium]|nr:hydrolase [Bacteroidota bacterium]
MKISIIQYAPIWENPADNILKIEELLSEFREDTDLMIFPEMTLTGFTMNSTDFAEEIDGISTMYFLELSKRLKTNIFAGIIEKYNEKKYNSLVHFNSFGLINARYRKVHPFSLADEDANYDAGKELVITKIDNSKFGLSVCYDLRFPELYRKYAKENVSVMINIANWPVKRIDHWRTLAKARAIENQCFFIGVNRIGSDPFNEYNGCSCIFDPLGNELLLKENDEGIFNCEIDLSEVKEIREKLPFLKDMKLI